MSWLNSPMPVNAANIPAMFVTLDVSHEPIGWLNALSLTNMVTMTVTLDVSHEPIGWLNVLAALKQLDRFVTSVVTILSNGTGDAPTTGVNAAAAAEIFLA